MIFSLVGLGAIAVFFLPPILLVLLWKLLRLTIVPKNKPKPPSHFDVSQHKVSDKPHLWVFDNLLSKEFLDYIDEQFETQDLPIQEEDVLSHRKVTKSLKLPVDERTEELTKVLQKLGHFVPTEACPVIIISDVWGDDQGAHLDHVPIDELAPLYQNLQFLDPCKQRHHPDNPRRIVPTLSFVVYFNDEGSLEFPEAGLQFEGKRGRIFMWQNYDDAERPEANPLATHYGTYSFSRAKRVMACGVLANQTPDVHKLPSTKGTLYCPNACGHHQHHENLHQTYSVGTKFFLKTAEDACMFPEVEVVHVTDNGDPESYRFTYDLHYKATLVNDHLGLAAKQISLRQDVISSRIKNCCGWLQDEVCAFFILSHMLGLDDCECLGWICACHLCTPVPKQAGNQIAHHKDVLQKWKEAGVLANHFFQTE